MYAYKLDNEDAESIREAIAERGNIWQSEHLLEFKRKVKEFYRAQQDEQCCYCRKLTVGEFSMVLDIEHILPKGNPRYRNLMFEPKNLSVACKRCNMSIKRQDTSFVNEIDGPFFHSGKYKFIHPHSDCYWEHIEYSVVVENNASLVHYTVNENSSKGVYTYEYFRLDELEVNSFNEAQGVEDEEISPQIDDDIRAEIRQLMCEL